MIRDPRERDIIRKCPICGQPTYNSGACNTCKEKADQDREKGKKKPWKSPRPDRFWTLNNKNSSNRLVAK